MLRRCDWLQWRPLGKATWMADPAVIGRRHPPAMKTLELSVEGMTCAACSGAVEKALKQMPGVKEALK